MNDSTIRHRQLQVGDLSMHVAEAGEGPLVLLCHGFPECWYSWRHQLVALAAAGYHAVAPDMRGYGKSDAPAAVESYTMMHLVGDMTGLLAALGESQAVIVGHDWGSLVAWSAALLRPDRFRAVVGMSVPFLPRLPVRPTTMMKALAGDRFLYILYFQEPGTAEAELDPRAREMMRGMLFTASGSIDASHYKKAANLPKTAKFLDAMAQPDRLPAWLREEDLEVYVAEFERTGFRGGLNWYRNFDRNWELLAPFADLRIRVPALFVGGLRDAVVTGPELAGESPTVQMLGAFCDDLRGKVLLEGIGHWNQQEAPEQTNAALLEFLGGLDRKG
ncbi:MAG: alpha/beta hydrolase [Deltaproteobacteria bacterium]|nr:alpha/beta hydrolase [Deltaproteobacteria bacterium]